MTDEQKDALEWLDNFYTSRCMKHASTLKALLAEPRVPAEPSVALLKAMQDSYAGACMCGANPIKGAYRALYAHLTAPKTKTVEVWHVEYVIGPDLPAINVYRLREDAEAYAAAFKEPIERCVHVTGPHKQEVPND